MDQGGDHMLEDESVRNPPTMTAERMGRIDWWPDRQEGGELAPEWVEQA
jgi:hypothetical protein